MALWPLQKLAAPQPLLWDGCGHKLVLFFLAGHPMAAVHEEEASAASEPGTTPGASNARQKASIRDALSPESPVDPDDVVITVSSDVLLCCASGSAAIWVVCTVLRLMSH